MGVGGGKWTEVQALTLPALTGPCDPYSVGEGESAELEGNPESQVQTSCLRVGPGTRPRTSSPREHGQFGKPSIYLHSALQASERQR